MPANKNAYIRYKVMDECFRDWNKRYTWEKLQDKVNDVLALFGECLGPVKNDVV